MSDPPVEIPIKDDAKPIACHKATPIPLHWQKTVESDLKRDEALEVIDRIEVLPKYIKSIKNFSTPNSTTEVRSWFSLVNQVANCAQLRKHLEPFRKFLSPGYQFQWTPELDATFELSKQCIIDDIKSGVETFDRNRTTCLQTDWSKQGVGYFLF